MRKSSACGILFKVGCNLTLISTGYLKTTKESTMQAKVNREWVQSARKVSKTKYRLGPQERAAFENAPIVVVFSSRFLSPLIPHIGNSAGEVSNRARRLRNSLEAAGVDTIRDLARKTQTEIFEVRGLGSESCALILDVLQLFGYKLKVGEAAETAVVIDVYGEALALLEMLGIE